MGKQLNVEVVTPTGSLWSGGAAHVSAPAIDGRLGILPGRQPLLAVLGAGKVGIKTDDQEINLEVNGGFISVDADFVTVVAREGSVL